MVRRKSPVTEETVEYSAKRAQNLYLTKQYALLLPRAERLRQIAQAPAYDAIVLTSYIWSVKAMQVLHHPHLAQTIDAYLQAAKTRQHPQHLMQAAQFKLDHALAHYDYERAIDALEATLLALGESEETLPLLYQIAEIEIACTHFESAKRRLDALFQAKSTPAPLIVMAHRLMYSIYDITGEPDKASLHLDHYFSSLDVCREDEDEIAEAMQIRAELLAREGKLKAALDIRKELDTHHAERLPEAHEKRRANDIQMAELAYYSGQAKEALGHLQTLSDAVITEDPHQTTHICRTLALTRCMLSLDVIYDILSPERCKIRLKAVHVPALPLEAVSEELFHIQFQMYRKNMDGLDQRIEDLRHKCQFLGLKACLAPIDATHAEYCLKTGDTEKAAQYALEAKNGFHRRHDEVSEARVEARILCLDPKNLSLEQRLLQKADAFILAGHTEIALTLYLAMAQANLARGDKEAAKHLLKCAQPLLQQGYMGLKEEKYKKLSLEADERI